MIIKPETGQLVKLDLWREITPPPRWPERQGGGASGTYLEKIGPHVNSLSLRELRTDLDTVEGF